MDIELRLARLERSARRWRLAAVTHGVEMIVAVGAGA